MLKAISIGVGFGILGTSVMINIGFNKHSMYAIFFNKVGLIIGFYPRISLVVWRFCLELSLARCKKEFRWFKFQQNYNTIFKCAVIQLAGVKLYGHYMKEIVLVREIRQ